MSSAYDAERDGFAGTMLADKYRIVRRLAHGGMGSVYEAVHVLMDRRVAIKTIHSRYAQSDPACLKRFHIEAKALSCLSHPNIITVFDFGISNEGIAYMVMDYIDGVGLDSVLKREHVLSPGRLVHLFSQACDALSHAHEQGIVHRDLKPSNIMISRKSDGSELLRIVDFGIAKILPGQAHSLHFSEDKSEVIGSPLYMSPEQCLAKDDQDGRSDIYSLGCLMYEALTGHAPMRDRSVLGIMYKHINEAPRPFDSVAPALRIPAKLEEAVFRSLAKDADERFQNMQDLRFALHRALSSPTEPAKGVKLADTTYGAFGQELGSVDADPNAPNIQIVPYLLELSDLYCRQGHLQKAEANLKQAITQLVNAFGSWDARIAEPLKKLAEFYRDTSRIEESEPLYFDLLAIKRKVLGMRHPDIACVMLGLAEVLFATGKYDSAKRYYVQCAKIAAELLGENSPALIPAFTGIAICQRRLGQFDDAENILKRTLELKEFTYGPEHYDLASTLFGLGVVQRFQGNLPDAERSLLRALDIYELSKTDGIEKVQPLLALAEIYSIQQMDGNADELYGQAVGIAERCGQSGHEKLVDAYENWGAHHLRRLNFAEAESMYRKVLVLKEKSCGGDEAQLAHVLRYLSEICQAQEKFSDARAFLERAQACECETIVTSEPAN